MKQPLNQGIEEYFSIFYFMVYAVAKPRRFLLHASRPAMPDPCYPAVHVAASLTKRPVFHSLHHAVGRVVHHARPHGIAGVPAPVQPAASCARMPGSLPSGPGASASASSVPSGAGPAGQALESQAAGAGAVGGASGGAKALAAAAVIASLAVGGALMAANASGTPSANRASAAIMSVDGGTVPLDVTPTFGSIDLRPSVEISGPRRDFPPSSQTPGNVPGSAPENITDVPEPASFALLGFGALAAICLKRRYPNARIMP